MRVKGDAARGRQILDRPTHAPGPRPGQTPPVKPTVMVRALMCQACDFVVPMTDASPAVRIARHARSSHGRDPLPSERTPTEVPVDVPAANGVA
jgi:hypothetical protein